MRPLDGLLLVGCDLGEDVVAVGVRVDAGPDLDHFSGGRDEEGVAAGELHVAVRGDRNTIGIDDLVIRVSKQFEGERVLGAERLVALDRIERDAEDDRAERVVLGQITLEVMRLDGAALSEILGIEVQNDPFASEIVKAYRRAILRI